MPNIITVKIDVTKLDKSRFFRGKADSSGHCPIYADIVLVPRRETGRFGDTHIVKQSKKRDEQVEMPILGSATERGASQGGQSSQQSAPPPAQSSADGDDDVPF